MIIKAFRQQKDSNPNNFNPGSDAWLHKFHKENPQFSMKNIKYVAYIFSPPTFLNLNSLTSNRGRDRGNNRTWAEILPDTNTNVEAENISKTDFQKIIRWAKERFPEEIDQAIIEERIATSEPKTEKELGDRFSITRQAIKHRYNKIIREMRDIYDFTNEAH
ncbi:MAG: hypothetical protein OXM55_04230 [Bdellovibrionales bacterium]|nr:hypothetical protein [Bdellovibrionales bacterium]